MESRSKPTKRSDYESSNQQPIECSPAPDVNYFLTLDGLLKCLAIALNFLSFLCISVGGGDFLGIGCSTFFVVIGLSVSIIFLLLYVFHVADNYDNVPWELTEMVYTFVWSIFEFIGGSVLGFASSTQNGTFAWAIASFFCFSAMCVYGLDCYLKFTNWKSDLSEDGEQV